MRFFSTSALVLALFAFFPQAQSSDCTDSSATASGTPTSPAGPGTTVTPIGPETPTIGGSSTQPGGTISPTTPVPSSSR